jgi:nucleotide-binding universal stress UspA family protein
MSKLVTFLVPTDSSAAAKNAARYAAGLGAEVGARVVLLSVIEMDTSETVLSNWKKLETQMRKSALRDLEKLKGELTALVGKRAEITTDLTDGIPMSEAVARYAAEKKVDLIVMGTKGATGLKKILQGSNTARLMEISPVPVVAIPSKATFTSLKKLVYATDMKNIAEETRRLARIAEPFKASILILHCIPEGSPARVDRSLEPELINQAKYGAISYHQVQSDHVDEAIARFMNEMKADMLVMFTHQRSFFDKLLGKSVTRSMAFQSRVPLLAFNRPVS